MRGLGAMLFDGLVFAGAGFAEDSAFFTAMDFFFAVFFADFSATGFALRTTMPAFPLDAWCDTDFFGLELLATFFAALFAVAPGVDEGVFAAVGAT